MIERSVDSAMQKSHAKELCHSYESGEPKLLKVREAEAKKKTLFRNLKMEETVLIHSFT